MYKIISNISALYFFWITFFSFPFSFLSFFLSFFFFFSERDFFFKVYISIFIVRVTRSMLAGSRLPSVKIRVSLPFLLRATWSSYLLQVWVMFGSKGIHCAWFFSETRDTLGLIYHTFLSFHYCRCPSRTSSWKLKLCKGTTVWKVCEYCNVKDWYKWLVLGLVHQLPNDSFQRTYNIVGICSWL